jgi:dihydrofolate synthase / folylpolyglutamate synthase
LSARTLEQWLQYQQGVHGQIIDLSLERVRQVGARLGLLQRRCPSAIIAGTNGKGSTATMLAQLLQAAGRRVGLYTSPHLVRYSERVRIDGREVADEPLVGAFERIEAARGSLTLTFFEYGTLAALQIFHEAAVDVMVLEVGLGGRLDATNIIDADVAVLCSVGMDHRDWLGDSLEQIGAEKAGVFRPGHPAVLGSLDLPASVWQRLREIDSPAYVAQRDFQWRIEGEGYAFEPWHYRARDCLLGPLPAPALPGPIQYANAASALMALQLLYGEVACEPARVAQALRSVQLPGRFQIVPGEVEWILDVAHNEPAARVLAQGLRARRARGRTFAVAGILADKDAGAIARVLDGLIDQWVLASVHDEPRALSADALAARVAPLRAAPLLEGSVEAACERVRSLARAGDRVVVLGSFHVVGPALSWLGLY